MNQKTASRWLGSNPVKALLILPLALLSMTLGMNAEAQIPYDVVKVSDHTIASGLNNHGQVVGQLRVGDWDPFIWSETDGMMALPKPPVPSDIDFSSADATDVNDNGSVVGGYFLSSERYPGWDVFRVPFIYRTQNGTELLAPIPEAPSPTLTTGWANAVNDDDHVVGFIDSEVGSLLDDELFPTYWFPKQGGWTQNIVADQRDPIVEFGQATDLRNTGGVHIPRLGVTAYPTIMNHARFIRQGDHLLKIRDQLGYYWDGNGSPLEEENKTTISTSGNIPGWLNDNTEVIAMNETGQVVGFSDTWVPPFPGPSPDPSADGAFVYDLAADSFTPLPWLPDGHSVKPSDINDAGMVVGQATTLSGEFHAFLWTAAGGMQLLDDLVDPALGLHFTRAAAINDGGQIVAIVGENTPFTSYLLTPAHDLESLMAMVEAICEGVDQHDGRMQRKIPGVLTFGQCHSLIVKIEHAAAYVLEGRYSEAQHALVSFENQVWGFLWGGTLTPAQAHPMLVASKAIRNELSLAKADGDILEETPLPVAYGLGQNVPNPFNPTTRISFTAAAGRDYTLMIYDVAGKAVRTFTGTVGTGPVEITWEGTDESGDRVGSGVYFYTVKAGDFRDTKKMVMLK